MIILNIINNILSKLGIKNQLAIESIKYLFVGGVCTLLDIAILFISVEICKLNYLPCSVFSFISGVILNYFLCTFWVFNVRILKKKRYEFLLYVVISLIGLGINTACISFFTSIVGLYFLISKLLSCVLTYFWNVFARKFLLHYKSKEQ